MNAVSLSLGERSRYARQMLLPDVGAAGQVRLKSARVLIVGAGGLGSPAALYLAAAGVGALDIMDFDRVEASNLHRQVLFAMEDVGQPKAEAAARRLAALNPEIRVTPIAGPLDVDSALDAVAGNDLVIDGTDNFAARYLINDACVIAGVPYAYASIFRHEGLASLLATPGGPCYRCLYPEPPPPGLAPTCSEGGVLGVLPAVMGAIQATEALKYLLGLGESLAGRVLQYDALEMRFGEFRVERDPACPICAPDGPMRRQPLSVVTQACAAAVEPPVEWISAAELLGALRSGEAGFLLDVRSEEEHAREAIAGSACIPLPQLQDRLDELPPETRIVCYCHSGVRSERAVRLLGAAGMRGARSLEGGILMWDPAALA